MCLGFIAQGSRSHHHETNNYLCDNIDTITFQNTAIQVGISNMKNRSNVQMPLLKFMFMKSGRRWLNKNSQMIQMQNYRILPYNMKMLPIALPHFPSQNIHKAASLQKFTLGSLMASIDPMRQLEPEWYYW